jgi:hypothetical protein
MTDMKRRTSSNAAESVSWSKVLRVVFAFGLILGNGCSTFDPANVAGRPWDRPTKEEILQPCGFQYWPFQSWEYEESRRTGEHYP